MNFFFLPKTLLPAQIEGRQHSRQGYSTEYQSKYIDGAPIASRSRTHPSQSPTSRFFFSSSLSLGLPFPGSTQCVRGFLDPSSDKKIGRIKSPTDGKKKGGGKLKRKKIGREGRQHRKRGEQHQKIYLEQWVSGHVSPVPTCFYY